MKVFTESNIEADSVELLLNYQELKELTNALVKFEAEIKQFKANNKEKNNLGFTHMHFKDCCSTSKNSKADIVFYVDLGDTGDGSMC